VVGLAQADLKGIAEQGIIFDQQYSHGRDCRLSCK
jgi:hypothetical protein